MAGRAHRAGVAGTSHTGGPLAALPWLERFRGKIVVIKFGGNAMVDEGLKAAFAQDVVLLRYAGVRPVVVHGGGPQISAHLGRLGIKSHFTNGLRVTTPEAMDVVRMVLAGQVQRELVGLVNRHGPFAVGMTGEDAHTMTAVRRHAVVDGERVDLGQVGDIAAVDPSMVRTLLADGRVPVISPVARGADGDVYNVNADTAAAAVAAALGAELLVMLTDVAGLYRDWPRSQEVVRSLTASQLADLLPGLASGMVPKMEGCLRAVRAGVGSARVLDGRVRHGVLSAFGGSSVGTEVVPDARPAPQRPRRDAAAGVEGRQVAMVGSGTTRI
ncbi:acetylglutamate kinase [Kitasatospora sp. NPDC058218]|uniref:acetylglutamate kinase n=1 Tax=Kitasatospora sp. NPDC058218 TaxID=3346385 RepID=UPI0036DDA7C1